MEVQYSYVVIAIDVCVVMENKGPVNDQKIWDDKKIKQQMDSMWFRWSQHQESVFSFWAECTNTSIDDFVITRSSLWIQLNLFIVYHTTTLFKLVSVDCTFVGSFYSVDFEGLWRFLSTYCLSLFVFFCFSIKSRGLTFCFSSLSID